MKAHYAITIAGKPRFHLRTFHRWTAIDVAIALSESARYKGRWIRVELQREIGIPVTRIAWIRNGKRYDTPDDRPDMDAINRELNALDWGPPLFPRKPRK